MYHGMSTAYLVDLVPYGQKTLVKCKCEQKAKQSSRDVTQDVQLYEMREKLSC